MRRREFVAVGAVIAGARLMRGAAGYAASAQRAAIAIGVDKAGDLPKLRAARAGALAVAKWLVGEGFEVKTLTDAHRPVKASDIFDAVEPLVKRGTLDQLVIYFAGHGFVCAYSEYWLLSGAPHNPNEAVSVVESVALARQSGIPSVVIISDACRSTAGSLGAERVHGSLIFPQDMSRPDRPSDVDVFYATLVGDPAWEVSMAESVPVYEGIFTAAFLDAFKRPDTTMVRAVNGKQVVPNFQLKPYLIREVPRRAQAKSINLKQNPEVEVVSDWNTYIGRVLTNEMAAPDSTPAVPTLRDVAALQLDAVGLGLKIDPAQNKCKGQNACRSAWNSSIAKNACKGTGSADKWSREIQQLARETGFAQAQNAIAATNALPEEWLVRTGLRVIGREVASIVTHPQVDSHRDDTAGRTLVEIDLGEMRAASLLLRFADGSGTVIAALDGYIGEVAVDEKGVANVSYLPSRRNPMWDLYRGQQQQIAEMHGAIAAAARFGVFRIDGERDFRNAVARQLADRIHGLKSVDPTLGLYAAYAYSDAGLNDQVLSIRDTMLGTLGVRLFGIEMLSGSSAGHDIEEQTRARVPLCPMLSQGWSLLRVRNVSLPPALVAARNDLRPALWTTFGPEGTLSVEKIFHA